MLGIVAALLVLVLGLVAFFSAVEYRPKQVEGVPAEISAALPLDEVEPTQELTVLTWNIGYAGLGANADFFMDGGEEVQATDEARMEANLLAIADELDAVDPDIAFLQEVDRDSTRSYGIDQEAFLTNLRLEAYDDGEGKRAQTEALMRVIDALARRRGVVAAGRHGAGRPRLRGFGPQPRRAQGAAQLISVS